MRAAMSGWGLALAFGLASAVAGEEIRVEPTSMPMALSRENGEGSKVDVVIEASGVEPIGDGGLVLVAHDKSEELYVVDPSNGRIVGEPIRCADLPTNPKWEGMARDQEGNYYLIGAHTAKTEETRKLQAQLIRFRLKGDGTSSQPFAIEPGSVRRWKVRDALAKALGADSADVSKLKVEGLAVYDRDGKKALAIGLREPTDLVRVFTADISQEPAADSELSVERLFAFQAGKNEGQQKQLTALDYVPAWKGFFVVTATEDRDNAFHGNTLWFVPLAAIAPGRGLTAAQRVYDFEVAMKCEGMADLPAANGDATRTARLVLTFDNDPHATHIPSRIQTLKVTRGGR